MCLQGLGLFGSVEGHVAGCCEQGNELSFYVKCVFMLASRGPSGFLRTITLRGIQVSAGEFGDGCLKFVTVCFRVSLLPGPRILVRWWGCVTSGYTFPLHYIPAVHVSMYTAEQCAALIVPTRCTILCINIKHVSATCFGTSVQSSGSKTYQFQLDTIN